MARSSALAPLTVERKIILLRGERVMLDADLAALYGVETKMLTRAVRRNEARFPADFMFQLTAEEHAALRIQSDTSNSGRGGRRYLGESVDILSIRERRTLERVRMPSGPAFKEWLRVSPDGERFLVGCGKGWCFFSHGADGWSHRMIGDACPSPETWCKFVDADPEVRMMLVGTGLSPSSWSTLLRYDLVKGERSAVTVDAPLEADEQVIDYPHGLLVAPTTGDGDISYNNAIGVRIVRLGEPSFESIALPAPSHFEGATVDEASGAVRIETSTSPREERCIDVTVAHPPTSRPCKGDHKKKTVLVPGTKISFRPRISSIDYAR